MHWYNESQFIKFRDHDTVMSVAQEAASVRVVLHERYISFLMKIDTFHCTHIPKAVPEVLRKRVLRSVPRKGL